MSNAIVLDPFGGSGSTLIACEQTDRVCRTIELDEKFCDVIVKRYIEQVGKADDVSLLRAGLTYRYDEVVRGRCGRYPTVLRSAPMELNTTLTLGSLFDGSGGFPVGWSALRITPVWASEIEPFPIG